MDTIFKYEPTANELEEITGEATISIQDYNLLLEKKASNNDTSIEYEAIVDIQELFSIRNDQSMVNHFTSILNSDFSDTRNKLFNE